MANEQLASILDRSGHPATVAWAHDGVGALGELPDPELAIEAAGQLGNVAALVAVSQPKPLRKAAAAALHKLKSRGVKVQTPVPARSFTLSAEAVHLAPRAFLSVPNELGNHHLVLTATDTTGSCIMELIIAGDTAQDHHGHASRSELRSFWRALETDASMQEVPFTTGLHLGFAAVQGKHAHGWDHLLEKLDGEMISAAKRVVIAVDAIPEVEEAPTTWALPARLVPPKVVAEALDAMAEKASPDVIEEWSKHFATQALDVGRDGFLKAAQVNARVFSVLGRKVSAAKMLALADSISGGIAGAEVQGVIVALNFAVLQESQHRQDEQRKDLDAMMKMIGNQGGE